MQENMINVNNILRSIIAPQEARLLVSDIFIGLTLALLIGLFISFIYKKNFQGVLYSYSFSDSLILMTMITALVIMTIGINLVLTLGMVGALSIVRFRTAIKDPIDIVFIFWSISVGLAIGAKLYLLAIIGAIFISFVVILLFRRRSAKLTFMLIIRYNKDALAEQKVTEELKNLKHSLKSKTLTREKTELIIEVRLTGEDFSFMDRLSSIYGVSDAVLLRYSGEHVS